MARIKLAVPPFIMRSNSMHYPEEFPLEEIKTIIAAVKGGKVKEEFQNLAHSAWVVQGYAQANIIGSPGSEDNPTDAVGSQSASEDFDPIGHLEAMVAAHESGELTAQSLGSMDFILNWVVDNFAKWLKEWLTDMIAGDED